MSSPRHALTTLALLTLLPCGCATVVPTELVEARDAYAASSNGPAATLAPTEVYDAKKTLDQANAQFKGEGDTLAVRDYAYIAKRKFELADVKARIQADREATVATAERGVGVRDEQQKSLTEALAATRNQLKEERSANQLNEERSTSRATAEGLRETNRAQSRELDSSAAKLEEERLARGTAESKLAAAMRDLVTVAGVKEDSRGTVLTLSGSVLFASGRATLLETAKIRLDQIADALKGLNPDQHMEVQGYTDDLGGDAINQPLSLHRANAVMDYLLQRGVHANLITAVGMGSSRPLVENSNAENRANNRRVEIVIKSAPVSQR